MRSQDIFLDFWLDDENSTSMLKNRICPGNKPRLFWVMFKLMIFQNFKNFHTPKIWKILQNQPGQAPRVSRPAPFIVFILISCLLIGRYFCRPLIGWNLFGAIKDLVLYFSIFCPKKPKFGRLAMLAILELTFEGFKHMFKILNPWSHP